jgi:hypothetical protein
VLELRALEVAETQEMPHAAAAAGASARNPSPRWRGATPARAPRPPDHERRQEADHLVGGHVGHQPRGERALDHVAARAVELDCPA